MTLNYTLSDYSQQIDEGFFDSLKQGFQSKYDQARGSQENEQDLQKYAKKAIPAIQQAASIAQKYSKKVGIPLPLATVIVAAGIVGGPTAIPFAALMYFVKKPVNKIAGKAFDAGVQKMDWQQPQPQQQPQLAWNLNLGMGFREYLAEVEMYEESWLGDKFNRLGGAIGKGAGYVSGKTAKYSANISNLIKSSFSELSQFAKKNKLAIAKVAFLMAVGAVIGTVIGAAVGVGISGGSGSGSNVFTQGKDVIASTAVDAVQDSGTVPQNDMEWLQQNFKPEVIANPDVLTYSNVPEPLDDVLTILVDGRDYAVWRSSDKSNGYFPANLKELVQRALDTKPNEDGLQVRILRSDSARVTAWQNLQSELVQAGVPAKAIVLTKDLVTTKN